MKKGRKLGTKIIVQLRSVEQRRNLREKAKNAGLSESKYMQSLLDLSTDRPAELYLLAGCGLQLERYSNLIAMGHRIIEGDGHDKVETYIYLSMAAMEKVDTCCDKIAEHINRNLKG